MWRAGMFFTAMLLIGTAFSKDPFLNKENAVGYIVLDNHGIQERYIVVEGKSGTVKLIKTEYKPEKVLKKGGKKK